MIIIRDTTGTTIKHTIDDVRHVRIGVLVTSFWDEKGMFQSRSIGKPHDEFTINDCQDLLNELDSRIGV